MEAQAAVLPAAPSEAPAEAPAEQPAAPAASKAKAKRGGSGLPPHVQLAANKKAYYARLRWLPLGATVKRYDTIPGLFSTPEAAAAAQAAAQELLQTHGPEAVWRDGLPTEKKREKRDAAYWVAEKAARDEKATEKAAAKAAREAAEAARPKKPRCQKEQLQSVPLPSDRNKVTVECVRDFLVDPLAAGTENAAPQAAPVQCSPIPVPVPPEFIVPPMPQRVLPPIPVALAATAVGW